MEYKRDFQMPQNKEQGIATSRREQGEEAIAQYHVLPESIQDPEELGDQVDTQQSNWNAASVSTIYDDSLDGLKITLSPNKNASHQKVKALSFTESWRPLFPALPPLYSLQPRYRLARPTE